MIVYVYYEMNYHDLACETAPCTGVEVFGKYSSAVRHLRQKIEEYSRDGFVVDAEAEMEEQLSSGDSVDISLFSGYQDNWDEAFSLCIEQKEVK